MKSTDRFLSEHKIRDLDLDIQQIVDIFTLEMLNGLESKESSLRMIPTYTEADNKFITDMPVVAIDAGGTNFRAALAKFNVNGKLEISDMVSTAMPGIDGEITKSEFFGAIAGYIRTLAAGVTRIGFCFSYPTRILPDRDGILLQFCKEVQAPEVVGQLIGKNLLETLGMTEKKIVLLNDTVATLLAGKSASFGRDYDSFIGFILGTGTNTCYIESNRNILKNKMPDETKSQIINIESGNFGKAPRTDIDLVFDSTTTNPGSYTFEKMISGGYFGGLCLTALKTAAGEGVFRPDTVACLKALGELSSEEVNDYISNSAEARSPLHSCIKHRADDADCREIINCLIDRAAKLVAANLAAVILKTGKGRTSERPLLLTIEGTIYYRLHRLKAQIDKYLREYLSGDKQRYFEYAEVQHSSLAGAALAALID